ncbi:MAG: type II toxin-antitoxin system VapC family toxin [bacterium]
MNIFLDTNIIIYFLEKNYHFFEKVIPYFEKAEKGEIKLYTSSISYMEVLIPVFKKQDIDLEAKYNYLFKTYLNSISIDLEIARIGAQIRAKYAIKVPDALQIACALNSGCKKFITADKGLDKIKKIEIVILS